MDYETNALKSKCHQILNTERKYQQGEIMYLGNQMKMLDQEVLEDHLRTLNFNELKIALRGGVPGHCNFIANQLLNEFKEKIDAYVHAKE